MDQSSVDQRQATRPQAGRARTGDGRARRLERLIPLIHDLLAWELVVRTESGTYVLADDVQQRLQEAVARQARPGAQVYFGRPCQRCGATGITRLVDGVRVCASCGRPSTAATPRRPGAPATAADGRPANASIAPGANGNASAPGNGTAATPGPGAPSEGRPERPGPRQPHTWWYRKVG